MSVIMRIYLQCNGCDKKKESKEVGSESTYQTSEIAADMVYNTLNKDWRFDPSFSDSVYCPDCSQKKGLKEPLD